MFGKRWWQGQGEQEEQERAQLCNGAAWRERRHWVCVGHFRRLELQKHRWEESHGAWSRRGTFIHSIISITLSFSCLLLAPRAILTNLIYLPNTCWGPVFCEIISFQGNSWLSSFSLHSHNISLPLLLFLIIHSSPLRAETTYCFVPHST